MSPRAVAMLLGGAAGLAAGVYLWRRFGVAFSGGVPTGLVELAEVEGVEVPAAEAATVRALLEDARRAGVALKLNSAFRGLAHQLVLWLEYKAGLRADGAAAPGHSNHQRGAREMERGPALDLEVQRSTTSPAYRWLLANGPRYGLKPVGTSFGEPWHWELVKKP